VEIELKVIVGVPGTAVVAVPVVVPVAEFKEAAIVVFFVRDALTVALPPEDSPVTVNVPVLLLKLSEPVFTEVAYVNEES
jgi:hypothetical protein